MCPYKHAHFLTYIFVRHRQTVCAQIRCRTMLCLVRVSTVWQNILSNLKKKNENTTQQLFKQNWTGPLDQNGKFHYRAILKKFFVCHHPTDSLKMPPTQNILWPFQRNNFLNSNFDIFTFIFNVFLTNQ